MPKIYCQGIDQEQGAIIDKNGIKFSDLFGKEWSDEWAFSVGHA
ncbi:MAG: hypothetical protein QXY52_05660 [Conexivisphaerales archaeon]